MVAHLFSLDEVNFKLTMSYASNVSERRTTYIKQLEQEIIWDSLDILDTCISLLAKT